MFKSSCLLSLIFSAGVVLSDKCVVVDPTSRYPVPDPTSASSSSSGPTPSPTSPTPSLTRDSCIQIADQLQFVKGGQLNSGSDGVNLDIGQAGQAQITNNPFAKSLRKESAGFSLPLRAVPGTPIKTFSPLTPGMVVHTDDYQINFIYSQVGSNIMDVKCHYKDEDISGGYKPTSSPTTVTSSPTPTPNPSSKEEECKKEAQNLSFVKGGYFDESFGKVSLDLGQAGQAQQSNNPFAKGLRKVSGGFEFDLSNVKNGPYHNKAGAASYTQDYSIKFDYEPSNKKVVDIKCHYQKSDL